MSRKTKVTAGVHLGVALAVALLAGCASAPAPSAFDETTTGRMSGPPDVPAIGCNAAALRQSVLQRVNQARTSGQMCGDARQAVLKPLVWQPALASAASRRASEMAQRGTFGKADRAIEQRLRQEGYRAVAAQENSAAGDYSPDMVAQTWLAQQQQCMALMNPQYTDVGAGCASAPGTEWGHYFTVVVARPGEGGVKLPAAKPKAKASSANGAAAVKAKPKSSATRSSKSVSAKKAAPAHARKCTTAACRATPAVR